MNTTKNWYRSKTLWAGALTIAGDLAHALLAGGGFTGAHGVVLALGLGMAVLRLLTTEGILMAALPLLLAAGLAGGCGSNIDWGNIIKTGGLVVQAGQVMTPLTCQGLELLGAPAEDIARCKKAEAAAKVIGGAYQVGAAFAGQWINAGELQVQGVGAVQVRALAPAAACPIGDGDKQPPGFDTSRVQPHD